MRNLILITNHYPHGHAESFIHLEIPFLQKSFDKVIVVSKNKDEETVRDYTFGNYRTDSASTFIEKIKVLPQCFLRLPVLFQYLINEYKSLRSNGKEISLPIVRVAFHDLFKALILADHIKRIIRKENLTGSLLLYSYWLTNSALATSFVESTSGLKISRVSRAHGGDVYEERHSRNYLSFREGLVRKLNFIFPISSHALSHIANQVPYSIHPKLMVQRLGTQAPINLFAQKTNPVFTLVSCSFMVPVKRVELIIDALAMIQKPLQWIHIGGGPLLEEMKQKAEYVVSHNPYLSVCFKGTLSSDDIADFYANHYVDMFINTSEYEGIPVSMMEAQSFSIPILGINTGGISEIVDDSVGALVERQNATPKVLAQNILKFILMTPEETATMRQAARKSWEARYQASENFSTFAHLLSTL